MPEARLVFMGMKHPNPDVPAMAMANHSRELAEQLGLTGRHVFFNETWVPYQDRADLLLDADIGVSCHFDHIETEFSFRTRILDYPLGGAADRAPKVTPSPRSGGNRGAGSHGRTGGRAGPGHRTHRPVDRRAGPRCGVRARQGRWPALHVAPVPWPR